jgi:hypothetical protein
VIKSALAGKLEILELLNFMQLQESSDVLLEEGQYVRLREREEVIDGQDGLDQIMFFLGEVTSGSRRQQFSFLQPYSEAVENACQEGLSLGSAEFKTGGSQVTYCVAIVGKDKASIFFLQVELDCVVVSIKERRSDFTVILVLAKYEGFLQPLNISVD